MERSTEEWLNESAQHGWPSFRSQEGLGFRFFSESKNQLGGQGGTGGGVEVRFWYGF